LAYVVDFVIDKYLRCGPHGGRCAC
jgi:hypothetical protein